MQYAAHQDSTTSVRCGIRSEPHGLQSQIRCRLGVDSPTQVRGAVLNSEVGKRHVSGPHVEHAVEVTAIDNGLVGIDTGDSDIGGDVEIACRGKVL